MLKAVKECLKNWLVTHERLYWYIVVGLAVLGFGIVTAMGMAKLERAEAAVRSDFENMLTEQLRSYRNEDKPMYAYLGYEIWEDGIESPVKTLLLIEGYSSTVFFRTQSGSFDMLFGFFPCAAINDNGSVRSVNGDISITDAVGTRTYKMYYLEGNIDFSVYDFPDWVTFDVPADPVEVTYLINAPYSKFVLLDICSPLLQDNHDEFDLNNMYWEYRGTIEGQPLNVEKQYITYSLELAFPTEEYMDSFFAENNWHSPRILETTFENVQLWRAERTRLNTVEFSIDGQMCEVETNLDGTFSIRLTYQQIFDLLSEKYPEMSNWFGDNELESSRINWASWFSHMHIVSMQSLVYTYVDSTTCYYGRAVIDSFNMGVTNFALSAYVSEDIFSLTDEELEKAISDALDIALENALNEKDNIILGMQGQINDMLDVEGAFSDYTGSDIWGLLESYSKGLISALSSVQTLGAIVAVIFSFLPGVSVGIMGTVFVVCILTAVVRFIRG